jgi:ketosteroid isomerase-like protein
MAATDEVREASQRFYAALNSMANGDAGPLAGSWLQGTSVTAMHPIGRREVGWDAVRGSFEQVARLAADGKIELTDQRIEVIGDVAYEVGVEQGRFKLAGQPVTLAQRVTNVYRREEGSWKMIHHHTDISPAMLDVLSRL